ncbi:MAG: Abortive infection protein [Candidatus Solibacter sp.]|nr:Abortive infection protein [Candidatus Solibacter sp.]
MTPEMEPERYPFWTYADVLVFAGLAIPSMLLGYGIVKAAFWVLRLHPAVKTWELLLDQFAGYGLLFGALYAIFRLQYGRPFWRSLAWNRAPLFKAVLAGAATVVAVSLLGNAIHTPNTDNPMLDLLKDRTSIVLIAIFGVTLGPLCEELAFRGFLQPLLVRSLGPVPGILAAALPFGILHFQEYGNSWNHVLLITLAGAAFGWMRHVTGSTKAATIMHGVYNALFFAAFLAQSKWPAR